VDVNMEQRRAVADYSGTSDTDDEGYIDPGDSDVGWR
jgi:hypothetical protein